MAANSYRHVHLVGAADGSKLRTAVFNEIEHIVVPVVAMVEGVVWAVNSEYPELVTAEELAVSPQQWNGRQAFAGHPEDGGTQVTANTPRVLETAFGYVFQTASAADILATRRLTFEVWLDPLKAAKSGPKAVDVITRLKAGKVVEVSVGCYVVSEAGEGVWEPTGKPYVGRWTDIVSDHIAFLGEDEVGACSVAAGCGAARAAVRHLVTAKGIERMATPSTPTTPAPTTTPPATTPTPPKTPPAAPGKRGRMGFMQRFMEAFRAEVSSDPGTSDIELRRALDDALRAVEPGYMGIDEVFPDVGEVVYATSPTGEWKTFVRKFTVDGDGKPTIAAKSEEVVAETVYKKASGTVIQPTAAAGTCGCGGNHPPKGTAAMKEATKNFIASSGGKFTEADAAFLDAIPEDKLGLLMIKPAETPAPAAPAAAPVVVPPVAAPVAAAAAPVATPAPVNMDDWKKTAPKEVLDLLAREQTRVAAQRTTLITNLKAAQTVYTEAELTAKPTEELEKLSTLMLGDLTADYSGVGLPRAAAAATGDKKDIYANPPNGYAIALAKARGETVPAVAAAPAAAAK